MTVSTSALASELRTDPKAMGYAALSDSDTAAKLNQPGASNETLPTPSVESAQALALLTLSDYLALSAGQQTYLSLLAASGSLQLLDTHGQTQVLVSLLTMFPSTTVSGAAMRSNLARPVSRAEVLFGAGTQVSQWDVAHARGTV
jgi:hypothetical protein